MRTGTPRLACGKPKRRPPHDSGSRPARSMERSRGGGGGGPALRGEKNRPSCTLCPVSPTPTPPRSLLAPRGLPNRRVAYASCTHSLPTNGLTVLCDSLCKVLFTFRSPYLCAVGPVRIFICLLPWMRYTIPREAAIPNSQTRGIHRARNQRRGAGRTGVGTLTLAGVPFQATAPSGGLGPAHRSFAPESRSQQRASFRRTHPLVFGGLVPSAGSLAVTNAIAVAFFSCPWWNALIQGVVERDWDGSDLVGAVPTKTHHTRVWGWLFVGVVSICLFEG